MKEPDKEKRKPTLADRFLHGRHARELIDMKHIDAVKAKLRQARRFVLDDEASERVAKVIRDIPELLIREHQFARAPYDLTWIEYPFVPFWETITGHEIDDKADGQVGYLIDGQRVHMITASAKYDDARGAVMLPIYYQINTEWEVQDQIDFAELIGISRLEFDYFFWGSSADKISPSALRGLRARNRLDYLPLKNIRKDWTIGQAIRSIMHSSSGDLRNCIALLLMMNRPSLTQYVRTLPNHRGFIGNKIKSFMSHTVVTINLDPVPTLRLLGTSAGEAVSRRRHEVRGHYCHDQTAREYMRIAGCLHEWTPCQEDWTPFGAGVPPAEVNHWRCSVCEGKRWWREPHERGTVLEGFVSRDGYEVTA